MARERRKISNLYEKEETYHQNTVDIAELTDEASHDEWQERYRSLSKAYGTLLDEARIITSVSDRLQNKLNRTHDKLQEKTAEINKINTQLEYNNKQLQNTIDELTKMTVSRKAATIVIVLAMVLFLISEGWIEPIIEAKTQSFWVGFCLKGVIALLIKPIEVVVEKFLMKQRLSEKQKG